MKCANDRSTQMCDAYFESRSNHAFCDALFLIALSLFGCKRAINCIEYSRRSMKSQTCNVYLRNYDLGNYAARNECSTAIAVGVLYRLQKKKTKQIKWIIISNLIETNLFSILFRFLFHIFFSVVCLFLVALMESGWSGTHLYFRWNMTTSLQFEPNIAVSMRKTTKCIHIRYNFFCARVWNHSQSTLHIPPYQFDKTRNKIRY